MSVLDYPNDVRSPDGPDYCEHGADAGCVPCRIRAELRDCTAGTRLVLTLRDIQGGCYEVRGTLTRPLFRYGFDSPSGAWGLYAHDGDTPSWHIAVRPYRKVGELVYRVCHLVAVRRGWGTAL